MVGYFYLDKVALLKMLDRMFVPWTFFQHKYKISFTLRSPSETMSLNVPSMIIHDHIIIIYVHGPGFPWESHSTIDL